MLCDECDLTEDSSDDEEEDIDGESFAGQIGSLDDCLVGLH